MAVAPRPVVKAMAPSSAMICRKPPIRPVLYLTGSSWTRVLTTSTGQRAPCVMEQQIPPDAAPLMTHMRSYWDKSADVARGGGASRTDPGNFDMMMGGYVCVVTSV